MHEFDETSSLARSMALQSNSNPIGSTALQIDLWHSNWINGTPIQFDRTPSLSIACTRTGFGPGSRRLTKSGVISAWLAGFPSASEASALDAL